MVGKSVQPGATVVSNNTDGHGDNVLLHLQQPGIVGITAVGEGNDCDSGNDFWAGKVLVAQIGTPYSVPIPKAAIFGKQEFAITIEESGVVSKIQYAKDTGAAQGLAVAGSLLDEFEKDSASEKANAIKAEADLIAAQQRLIRCQTNPANCT